MTNIEAIKILFHLANGIVEEYAPEEDKETYNQAIEKAIDALLVDRVKEVRQMKKCENCNYQDEYKTEQPCCGCVDGSCFEAKVTTEAEIMKALEKALTMSDEPIGEHFCCVLTTKIVKAAQDLISRKNAEIKALQAENKDIVIIRGEGGKIVEKGHIVYLTIEQIEQRARAEAIKEVFSEIENRIGIGNDILDFWDIFDELKKERGMEK